MWCREEPNWADLPELVLFMILKKVITLSGFFQFSAVCRTWRRVALDDPEHTRQRMETCSEQIPFLMVSVAETENMLYTLSGNKLPNFQLSIPYNVMCCGSSHGWMVIYTEVGEQVEITLYNPFSHNTIGNLPFIKKRHPRPPTLKFFLQKLILSINPSQSPHHFYIAVLHYDGSLAFLKDNHKSWVHIENAFPGLSRLSFADIIFHKGLLYAVDSYCDMVISFDFLRILNQDTNNQSPIIREFNVSPRMAMLMFHCVVVYLVESSRRDFLMVIRYIDNYLPDPNTEKFVVFKAIMTGGHYGTSIELVELNSLGGDALFVGGNYSSSVRASDFPGCQPDCVYFTDHFRNFVSSYDIAGPYDVGVYNIKNGSLERHHELFYTSNNDLQLPLPIWITPTPFGLC